MNDYEIRIVSQIDNAQLVVSAKLLSNHAAIRRAKILAGEGDMVEVWRGMRCVYSTMRASVH
jgi:DNA-binding transcriptional regulator/RsmH inhibitor MraZ